MNLATAIGIALIGHWTGIAQGPAGPWHLHMVITRDSIGWHTSVDFPDVNGYERAFTTTVSDSGVHLERPQGARAPIQFNGTVVGDTLRGTLIAFGHEAPFVLRRTAPTPLGYREESVQFHNGDVTLAGTLLLPATPGRHRALICVHGGGPASRSDYRDKAIYLARRGTAVLIYDKRGVGTSTGDWTVASPTDLAMDALAGIRLLRARADIDTARVGIDGFSQGGWIAPLAATMSPDIAFVIVGSAPGLTPADQSIYDVAHALATAGFDSSVVAEATTLRRRLYVSSTDSLARVALAGALDSVHTQPWFETSALPYPLSVTLPARGVVELLRLEPEPIWQRVTVPVLAYWGAHDQHLPPFESMAVVRRGLTSAHNSRLTVHIYPDADHTMLRVPAAAPWDFPRGVPFFQLIANWLDKR
jgi:pimeloyl-ACP methyl ester carboxylesterase